MNFGLQPYLQAGGGNRSYVAFDLSSLPTGLATSPIAKINLVLWVGRVGTSGSLKISQAAGSWVESAITANTEPGPGSPAGTIAVSSSNPPQFAYLNVTSVVQGWLANPSSNNGFVVEGDGSTVAYLDSKESISTSHEPVLEFVLTGPAGATGATGPAGATGAQGPAGPTGLRACLAQRALLARQGRLASMALTARRVLPVLQAAMEPAPVRRVSPPLLPRTP